METNKKRLELMKISNKPSILNKIRHKPNILFDIFPYITKRTFILPYIIKSDPFLINSLKKTLNYTRLKNFSIDTINEIQRFMVYYLMQAMTKDSFAKYIIDLYFEEFEYSIDYESLSFLEKINKDYIIKCFKKLPIPRNISLDREIIKKYEPKGLLLDEFIECYFSNEIILFYTPLKNDISLSKNKDIIYLNNLNSNNNKSMIILNLICVITINFNHFYEYMIKTNYEFINRLYFIYNDDSFYNIFNKVELYLNLIKHKENIKNIYFHKTFSIINKKETKYFEDFKIYRKIGLEHLVDNYLERINNKEIINFNLNSLENIEFDDENIFNDIQIFRLRYNLNKIFDNKFWSKLIVITPDDYNNIFDLNKDEVNYLNKKLDKLEDENTNYKILYLNFNNTSPYNENFAYFCEKFLYYNKYINIIIIDNLGNDNKENNYYNKMKDIKKLRFPNLKSIIFEDGIISNNANTIQKERIIEKHNDLYDINYDFYNNKEITFDPFGIKNFINNFFYFSNFNIYEGYNDENHLLYLKITKNISVEELYRIFFIENKVSMLKLIKENIEIKYNKNKKELNLINKNEQKEKQIKSSNINSFKDFFYELNKIMDLHFNNGEKLNIKNTNSDEDEEKEEEEEEEEEEQEQEQCIDSNKNDIEKKFLNSEILTEENEFSLLKEGILEIENIDDFKELKFELIYRAKSDKNKIDKIIDKIGKNKYLLIIIKTNKGNIFGAYAYFYDFYYDNKEEERKLGVVFNFKKEKLFYNVEGLIYKNDQGIEIKDYFYITKPSFSLKNKIINNSMEIGEDNFTCALTEVYDINNINNE